MQRLKFATANIGFYVFPTVFRLEVLRDMKSEMRFRFLLLAALLAGVQPALGQGHISEEPLRMSLFQIHGGGLQPFGDVGELYGTYANAGLSYAYKSRTNVLIGADFNYLFGDQVKNEHNLMHELRTSAGHIINREGEFVNFLLQTRGFATGFFAGMIFPIIGPNDNSGLEVRFGVDYVEHRTRIETRQDHFPPLQGEMLKGFDRKRAGIGLTQFVGYQHFSNSGFANFFVGIDVIQGFTTDYRSFNIDERRRTNDDYFDLFVGVRAGWVLPVYRRMADKFYIH